MIFDSCLFYFHLTQSQNSYKDMLPLSAWFLSSRPHSVSHTAVFCCLLRTSHPPTSELLDELLFLSRIASNRNSHGLGSWQIKFVKSLCSSLQWNYPWPSCLRGFPGSSAGKESACNAGDPDWIPGLGKSTGERIGYPLQNSWTSLVAQLIKNPLAMGEDLYSIPGLGRAPGERKGYPLQYSGLENSMDPVVHGVTKSRMRLSDFHFHFYVLEKIEISYLDLYSCSMMQSLSFF